MIGDAAATLVWISPQAPSAAESRAVASWARARGVTLSPPGSEQPPAIAGDASAADLVEDALDRARDAIVARDREGVERAVAAADALLRAHPDLAQAAWLMAELERVRATWCRRMLPPDVEAGERAWLRAEALDGGRVAGIGELGAPRHPADAILSLTVPGGDEADLDGSPLPRLAAGSSAETAHGPTRLIATVAGPHALVVTAGGAPVWAGWIEVPSGSSTIEIDAPRVVSCSALDFARVRTTPAGSALDALDSSSVTCNTWIAVVPGKTAGTVRIARCEASRCASLIDWPDAMSWARALPSGRAGGDVSRASRWPVWATWALSGAGVALTAGVVVVASGALQRPPPVTRFVTGGLEKQ